MWPYPRIVAHRGGGKLAPENTLAAMRCAYSYGFRAVEFDVMLAKDHVAVLMHDPHLGRTVAGSGMVSDYTAAELAAMDAGGWLAAEFAGEPVPRYEDVARFCQEHGIWMNVEIKPVPGAERETGQAVGELTRRLYSSEIMQAALGGNAALLPLFSSFSFDAVAAAHHAAPDIPRGFLAEQVPDDWQAVLVALGAVSLHVDHRNLTEVQAKVVRQAGYGLFCYTVNDPQRGRELFSWGVNGFCTDRIDLIPPDFA